jgi:RNA-directed DNA polymerase
MILKVKRALVLIPYADDFLLFAKMEEEIKRAGEIAKKVITELGLEDSMGKTKSVDFNNSDFNFLIYNFQKEFKSYRCIRTKS